MDDVVIYLINFSIINEDHYIHLLLFNIILKLNDNVIKVIECFSLVEDFYVKVAINVCFINVKLENYIKLDIYLPNN